jgi:hypothetical protein
MQKMVGILSAAALLVILVIVAVLLPKKFIQEYLSGVAHPVLMLDEIKVIKAQEQGGDELYFSVGARTTGHPTEYIRIPQYPDHWLSKRVDSVKNVRLWSGKIADEESVILLIELNEQDAAVLNPDDLLGVMRVRLKNSKGIVSAEWDVLSCTSSNSVNKLPGGGFDTATKLTPDSEKFELENNGAHYEVVLSLKK